MRLLIADDDTTTRTLLEATLRTWGYEIEMAEDGNRAAEVLSAPDPPRLAILDWMMPGRDGPALCRMLKERGHPYVYTLLLTSRNEKDDVVAGLEAGADDFLTKPVDPNELHSRLRVGERIAQYDEALAEKNRQLEAYADRMETLARQRARQLVHAERLATLGTLAAGVAHEINNPAGYIAGNVQLLEKFWETARPALALRLDAGEADASRVRFVLEEFPRCVEAIGGGVERISRIVSSLKSFARRDDEDRAPLDVAACVESALAISQNAIKHRLEVTVCIEEGLPPVVANASQIEQVLVNLLVNAADAMEHARTGHLDLRAEREGEGLRLILEDDGPGISPKDLDTIWEPFFTTKGEEKGTGLGLSISRGIIEDHGGTIRAENRPEGGARFLIDLPAAATASEAS